MLGLSANYVRVLQFRALRRAAMLEVEERNIPVTAPTLPYNEQALRVLEFSREEARGFNHNYVGTEHLLLGILREGSAAAELIAYDLTVERMRGGIRFIFERMGAAGAAQPPVQAAAGAEQPDFTVRTSHVLALAGAEAQRLKETAISPRHLLVAILREGQGVGAMLLQVSGVRWQQVGETLQISVISEDEGKPITLPAELQVALNQYPEVQRLFERMAGFKQRQLADWVEHAQGEAERKKQVEKVIEILQQARQSYLRGQGTGN